MYGVWTSPHRNLNYHGAHVVDVWQMMDVRHIRQNCKSLLLRVEAVIAVESGCIEREVK